MKLLLVPAIRVLPPSFFAVATKNKQVSAAIGQASPTFSEFIQVHIVSLALTFIVWVVVVDFLIGVVRHFGEKSSEIDKFDNLMILFECLKDVVSAKSRRFGTSCAGYLNSSNPVSGQDAFFEVTKPDQQIALLAIAIRRFFDETIDHDAAFSITILKANGDTFSEFFFHYPEDDEPRISMELLNSPKSTAMIALRKQQLVVVEDCKKEANLKKRRRFEPVPGSENENGSLLCYPGACPDFCV